MPFVEAEDGRLYYNVSGEGRWLVLIHGAWASHEWWRWQISELSRHYRVLSLDVRGHGQSSHLERAYSVDGFTKDLEIVHQKVGIDEVALVGWSMGGIISMQYCLNYPSKVKALILIATRGHRNPHMKRRILFQYLQARLMFLMDIASPRKYDRTVESFPGEQEKVAREVKSMLSPTTPKEAFDWVMADLINNPRKNYFEVAKSIWDWGAGEELRKISVPSLIMVGEKDDRTPPRFSRIIHEKIPNSRLVIVKDAGHCLALERPEAVNAEIIEFLKSLGY
ncbi:MAG: alpha/beta hydrolase [Deltaproteobacteria bacterium]|nr:alpha/beta hydrolase [Deltaproteobacteria bacterium]MBW2307907.1 alpha/beta hydrolase [Deltaproteobacteria bacterium]